MESIEGWAIAPFWHPGKCYGLLFRVQRRVHVVGALQRGIFWRFNAKIFQPHWFYWESLAGLRSRVGQVEFMAKMGMKDESLPVRFGRNRFRGSIRFSRTGIMCLIITWLDAEFVDEKREQIHEEFATLENELLGTIEGREEWY